MEKKVTRLNLFLSNIIQKKRLILIFIIVVIFVSMITGVFIFVNKKQTKLTEESIKMFQEAKKLYLEKKLDQSIVLLKKIIKKNKSFINGYFMLGKAYFFKGNKVEARKTWEKTLRMNPNHIDTLIWLGVLYSYDEKTLPDSINYFNRVLDLDSLNILANYNLAKIYFNMKKYKMSLYYFNNALENEYHLSEVHIDLAKIYKELNFKDKALKELSKAKNLTNSSAVLEEIKIVSKSISDNNKISDEGDINE